MRRRKRSAHEGDSGGGCSRLVERDVSGRRRRPLDDLRQRPLRHHPLLPRRCLRRAAAAGKRRRPHADFVRRGENPRFRRLQRRQRHSGFEARLADRRTTTRGSVYNATGKNWFVVSGHRAIGGVDSIFYEKYIVSAASETIHSLIVTYPAKDKARLRPDRRPHRRVVHRPLMNRKRVSPDRAPDEMQILTAP